MLWDSVTVCGLAPSQEPKLKLVNGAMCCIQYSTLKNYFIVIKWRPESHVGRLFTADLHISPQSDFSL